MEAFNLFNHTNYGNFSTTASVGTGLTAYGHPQSVSASTSLEYYARNLQFIGRFQF